MDPFPNTRAEQLFLLDDEQDTNVDKKVQISHYCHQHTLSSYLRHEILMNHNQGKLTSSN